MLSVELTKELIAKDILVLTAGCSSGGIENCGLMTPEAAKLAGPKLRAVCEKLNIPPVLNFGPCLAIGLPGNCSNRTCRSNRRRYSTASTGAFCSTVVRGTGTGRWLFWTGTWTSASSWTSAICNRKQNRNQSINGRYEGTDPVVR